jgi:hydrogenase maturation protease
MSVPRVLVLGIGNILLSDEGVGVHVINRFQKKFTIPDNVEVIDGGTMGLDLVPYFEGKTHVVVVDAMCADGQAPGTIRRFSGSDVMAMLGERISPHQIVLLGIVPESLDTGLEMTATIQPKVDVLVGLLRDELESSGIALELKRARS